MVWNTVDSPPVQFTYTPKGWPEATLQGLAAVESRLSEAIEGHHPFLTTAIENLVGAGGKRIRPLVCLLTAKVFEADFDRAVSLAAGVEMLHTATLVHDDLIDGSLVRRGAPTLNANGSPVDTVLAGDYLFARAAKLVAQAGSVRIMELFAETLMVILNGEITQRSSRWRIDRQDYYQRIYAKTAALFVLAAQAAAVLGDADQICINALVAFGKNIGLAFQIVDDVLDYTGTAEKIGKPPGNDLRQGLITLPAILFAEKHPDDPDMYALLQVENDYQQLISRAVQKVSDSSAIDQSLREARRLAILGQSALQALPPSEYREALSALAGNVTTRTK